MTVTFTCADQLSGIASRPAPSTVHNDCGTTVTGTAVDNAGNATAAPIYHVSGSFAKGNSVRVR